MALRAVHDKIEDIPEAYRDLYTEKGGKYELTGIEGVKTQADVDRVTVALGKEREDHKATREALKAWDGLELEDVQSKLDRIPVLEAAAKGKLNDAEIQELVDKQVEATIQSRLGPVERQLKSITDERDTVVQERDGLAAEKTTRTVHDEVRKALTGAKVLPEAHEDALMLAERVFEIRAEDGAVITRDQVGVTPGIRADEWLKEITDKRPHWWPTSQGSGASGSGGRGGSGSDNPWAKANWNITAQGQYVQTHGMEKAQAAAKSAGSFIGATAPAEQAA